MEKIKRIIISDISKKFMIGAKNDLGALARFVSLFSGNEPKKLIYVIKNLSFDVYSGEILGVVGHNGSGKSTLLRTIAGIYHPDGGSVNVNGKVISLINLTVGLKERLTMKENIFLVGALFGISQNKIKLRLQKIIDFSGLQEFINTKIYQFSEGMKQRLAFSVAINCDPDILLLDEVFEIGDEDFKKKSSDKIKNLVNGGACAISVSHDLSLIEKYCDRMIWLENGKIKKSGKTDLIIKEYTRE